MPNDEAVTNVTSVVPGIPLSRYDIKTGLISVERSNASTLRNLFLISAHTSLPLRGVFRVGDAFAVETNPVPP
jgi:hypothetical protein